MERLLILDMCRGFAHFKVLIDEALFSCSFFLLTGCLGGVSSFYRSCHSVLRRKKRRIAGAWALQVWEELTMRVRSNWCACL